MSVQRLILRIVFFPVMLITIGAIALIGFGLIEPFQQSLSGPPSSLGWGAPGANVLTFGSVAFVTLMLVIAIWFISAPIRNDRRQQFGR